MIHCNTKELRTWIKENDVFVVDRGFRDAGEVLEDIGIKMEMPLFMQKGAKQLSTRDSYISRAVTQVKKNLHAYVVYSYLLSQIKIIKFVWIQFLDWIFNHSFKDFVSDNYAIMTQKIVFYRSDGLLKLQMADWNSGGI